MTEPKTKFWQDLVDENVQLKRQNKIKFETIQNLKQRNKELLDQNKELREYAQHHYTCELSSGTLTGFWKPREKRKCTCGLDELLTP